MDDRAASRLAWGLWGLVIALCLAGFVLLVVTRDVPVGSVYGARGTSGVIAIPFATMGALLASRRPRNPIGWLFIVGGLTMAFVVFAENYTTYSFDRYDSTLPLTEPIAWFQNWAWVVVVATGLVYPFLLFPDGTLPSRQWRWVAWLAPLVLLAFGLSVGLTPGQLQSVASGLDNPYTIDAGLAETLQSVLSIPLLAIVVLAITALARRFRRSAGDQREQMKWLLFAGSLTAFFLLTNVVLVVLGQLEGILWQVVAILTMASIGGIGVAAAVAVLKYRLYDIEVIINRAVVFSVLGAFITAAYVGTIVGIGALVGSWGGSNVALPIVATAFVGVAFQPFAAERRSWRTGSCTASVRRHMKH